MKNGNVIKSIRKQKYEMPVQVEKELLFGMIYIVRPSPAQSEVFGRKRFFIWKWQLKEF